MMRLLGTVVAYVYTIEFQKRGLPHIHLMVTLDKKDRPKTPEQIDLCVSAELLDPELEPDLHRLVSKFMLHEPCRGRACWDGTCCKLGYPKPYAPRTVIVNGAYPIYLRQDDKRTVVKHTSTFSNRDVVPCNNFLNLMFECHVNVKVPVNTTAIKYLYKYITKGHDWSYMKVDVTDEVKEYLDARYVSAPEGETFCLIQAYLTC
jgi:hypothetical protein